MVLKEVKGGWKVFSHSGRPLSKHPLTKKKAIAQLRAIEVGKHRGQLTAVGVFMTFISLVVFLAIYPALSAVIASAGFPAGSAAGMVANLFPFIFLVVIILSLLSYGTPTRQYP